ncbi:MAG: aminotransferase [Alphaproteobacteria bacterium]|nr:aminotransferase [Alphaproteobacteria bacterium]
MKPLNPTFAGIGTTIFSVMSGLANQHGAINLGQGFPDTDGPLALRERAAQALIEGPNQYPPMMGVEALRQALSAHSKRFYDLSYDWRSEVVVTSGGTEALTASIMGIVKPGDEVIVLEPAYDSYRPVIEAVGGVATPIRLSAPDWALTEAALTGVFSAKTKAIMLNSPMNPAGKVFSAAEQELLAGFLKRFDAIAICDEVYEHLTFDGLKHVPLATLLGMYERCVRVGSAGKIFSLTGWKVGWVQAPVALLGAVAKAHQFITFTTPTALQIAVAHGLENFESYYLGLAKELEGNRDYLARELAAIGFEPLKTQGTYFLTTDISKLRFNGSDVDFCKHITEHARVAAIPLSVFFTGDAPQQLVRFAFCKQRKVLEEAVGRLRAHFKRN